MIRKRPETGRRSPGTRKSRKGAKSAPAEVADAEASDGTAVETEPEAGSDAKAEAAGDSKAAGEDEAAENVGEAAEAEAPDEQAADGQDEAVPAPKAAKKAKKKKEPIDIDQLALRLEALLFASGQALGTRRLSKVLGAAAEDIHKAAEQLEKTWSERSSALELVEVSGGWRLMTRSLYHEDVARLVAKAKLEKLSPAALETLAVVAYRQPIGRADIESVRGVQCGPLLRVLLDRDLIRITGRSSEPGHPLLYGTSKRFLDHFGLASLKNLPDVKDLLNVS